MGIVKLLGIGLFGMTIMATQSGCLVAAAAAAGAGAVAYTSGDLEATLDGKPDVVIEATRAAAKDMGFTVQYANGSSVDGQAKLRTGADKEVMVKVHAVGDKSSKIEIRVGTFGDETLSRQILEKVKANLPGAVPAASTPAAG